MGMFTVIPQDTFEGLQLDAGVLLKSFNPAAPTAPADSALICATTGGINVSCVPTFSDLGEDVDNCPVNLKELKHLDSWACTMSTTSLGTTPEAIKLALGCADVSGTSVIPRRDLSQSDFTDIWWVGDRADGGFVAVQLKNALSDGGFVLQTTKNGKGQTTLSLAGHVSIDAQSTMPMVFYSAEPSNKTYWTVKQYLNNVTSNFEAGGIENATRLQANLTAAQGYTFANVIVTMGGTDVTSTAYNASTHKVDIASVTGDVTITATANGD